MNEEGSVTLASMPAFEAYCAEIRERWDSRRLTKRM